MRRDTTSTLLLLAFPLATLGAPSLAAFVSVGCSASSRIEPGLANGPALGGDSPVVAHDVVANAHDSCPSRARTNDPLPQRMPACPSFQESAPAPETTLLNAKANGKGPDPAASGVPWNVHLEGLPPCDEPSSGWVAAEPGPVCAR
jgi:hypothetical protein